MTDLREKLVSVLDTDDPRLTRLSHAGTSVSFKNLDAPADSVTVLLDRDPPVVADGDEPAEITIELTEEQWTKVARGALSLPPALLTGTVAYRGPVRKYLTVEPVLRAMLAELDGGGH
jgi:putative sterol carrier protein